jgi:dTMP kinase
MLVAIEGLDAAGKATQAGMLTNRLSQIKHTKLFSFPRYSTPIGEVIKRRLRSVGIWNTEDALTLQCLMLGDKYDAAPEIRRVLARDHHVVCDRWIASGICYGAADGVDAALLENLHRGLPKATLNIFLDVSPEEALRRRPDARDRYEKDRAKQAAVRLKYVHMAESTLTEWRIVNGECSRDSVADQIWQHVGDWLEAGE